MERGESMTKILCQWCETEIEEVKGSIRATIPKIPSLGGFINSSYIHFFCSRDCQETWNTRGLKGKDIPSNVRKPLKLNEKEE